MEELRVRIEYLAQTLEVVSDDVKQIDRRINNGLREDISLIKQEMAALKVKSGFWGVFGGLIVAIPLVVATIQIVGSAPSEPSSIHISPVPNSKPLSQP